MTYSEKLNVHHLRYSKLKQPWEWDDPFLVTLCEDCHTLVHEATASFGLALLAMEDSGDIASVALALDFLWKWSDTNSIKFDLSEWTKKLCASIFAGMAEEKDSNARLSALNDLLGADF